MQFPKFSSWHTSWKWDGDWFLPPKGADFRDYLPPTIDEVVKAYGPHVESGQWTLGMFDCWSYSSYYAMHAVHNPCWCSFRWLPWRWRGICFGRTIDSCDFAAWHMKRWARATHGSSAGKYYECAYHGRCPDSKEPTYIKACAPCHWLIIPDTQRNRRICCLSLVPISINGLLGFILGWWVPIGTGCCNFAACYTCNTRQKLRRKYNLPTACLCCPWLDDCCVHFLCYHCATHQELREMAVRGTDGPGLHILDILPEDFKHVEGFKAAILNRGEVLERLKLEPPPFASRKKEGHAVHEGATAAVTGHPAEPKITEMQAPTIDSGMERGSESKV